MFDKAFTQKSNFVLLVYVKIGPISKGRRVRFIGQAIMKTISIPKMNTNQSHLRNVQTGWMTVIQLRQFSLSSSDTDWSCFHWLPPHKPLSLQGYFPLQPYQHQLETKQAYCKSDTKSHSQWGYHPSTKEVRPFCASPETVPMTRQASIISQ